jgi:hypothetical protein
MGGSVGNTASTATQTLGGSGNAHEGDGVHVRQDYQVASVAISPVSGSDLYAAVGVHTGTAAVLGRGSTVFGNITSVWVRSCRSTKQRKITYSLSSLRIVTSVAGSQFALCSVWTFGSKWFEHAVNVPADW